MLLGKWLLKLVVFIICMIAGICFGRTINSTETSGTLPDVQLVMTGPAGSSPSALAGEVPNMDLPKAGVSGSDVSTSPGVASAPAGPVPIIEWSIGATVGDLVPDITGHGCDARIHGQPRLNPTWGAGIQ